MNGSKLPAGGRKAPAGMVPVQWAGALPASALGVVRAARRLQAELILKAPVVIFR